MLKSLRPIPFIRPSIDEKEIEAVTRILRSKMLVGGPEVEKFENDFAKYLNVDPTAVVAVGSGTAGLHLTLEALGIGPGDEVILPTLTFSATAEAVERVGATPILADIDIDSFCISYEDVREKINVATKAIIPVHHSGRSCNMEELHAIGAERNILVIEDAAHAFTSSYEGKKIGTLSSIATIFSFYPNKTMTTGDGGMIVSFDTKVTEKCKKLRRHGIRFGTHEEISIGNLYDVELSGFKYNMTDIGAAIGRVQLTKVDHMKKRRSLHARRYLNKLRYLPLILPRIPEEKFEEHSWHLFIIRFKGRNARKLRNQAIKLFQKESIGFGMHYRPLHQHSHWSKNKLSGQVFPNADLFFNSALSIPLYPDITNSDIDRVCEVLATLFE